MPRYYCDYCDVYLTHDSTSVRKDHNSGRAHISNVRDWYAKYLPEGSQFPQFPPFAGAPGRPPFMPPPGGALPSGMPPGFPFALPPGMPPGWRPPNAPTSNTQGQRPSNYPPPPPNR